MNTEKYVDPNPYSDYTKAMQPEACDPMAVEWHNMYETALERAADPTVLDGHTANVESAMALLRCLKGAYTTDPLVFAVVAATTQRVMSPAARKCPLRFWGKNARDVWSEALLAHAGESTDAYVQMACLDQLRWCGKPSQAAAVRAVAEKAKDKSVKDFAAMVGREIAK